MIFGGWLINPDVIMGKVPKHYREMFDKAFKDYCGAKFEPLIHVGSQLVCGTNHMFICEATITNSEFAKSIVKVVINEDLEGREAKPLSVDTIIEGRPMGGLIIKPLKDLPKDAEESFKKATAGIVGAKLTALIYCGQGIINGIQYELICQQELVDSKAEKSVVLAKVDKLITGDCILEPVMPIS